MRPMDERHERSIGWTPLSQRSGGATYTFPQENYMTCMHCLYDVAGGQG
jgi:hypothetical protein